MPINKVMQCPISLNCGGYLLINSKIKSITSGAAWYLSLETTAIIIFSAVPGCMCSVKRVEGKADSGNKECCDNLQTRQDLASPWSRERERWFLLFQDCLHEFSHKAKFVLFTGCSCPGHLLPAAGLCQFPTIWNIPHPSCWSVSCNNQIFSLHTGPITSPVFIQIFILPSLSHWAHLLLRA